MSLTIAFAAALLALFFWLAPARTQVMPPTPAELNTVLQTKLSVIQQNLDQAYLALTRDQAAAQAEIARLAAEVARLAAEVAVWKADDAADYTRMPQMPAAAPLSAGSRIEPAPLANEPVAKP